MRYKERRKPSDVNKQGGAGEDEGFAFRRVNTKLKMNKYEITAFKEKDGSKSKKIIKLMLVSHYIFLF